MNSGGDFFFVGKLLRFNGGLFLQPSALPLTREHLLLLLEAAKCNWTEVEPAIFGTLLERALDPKERHALGAHYTPRSYVERLVRPTIEEPLRADWELVQAEVRQLVAADKLDAAKKAVRGFHQKLCATRVLDPACGSGNFLYVTLDLFKRLEAEVLAVLEGLGDKQTLLHADTIRVTPAQFLGIEKKRWAKEIAELVLWIGYLQHHFRTYGKNIPPPEPVLQDYKNIECRDAVLAFDREELVRDEKGKPVKRWDGETMKTHPVTGAQVPDEKTTVPVYHYVNPRRAEWPKADFIVGNPPFIGDKRMRDTLGEGYVEALREVYQHVGSSSDYVLYWWDRAATLVRGGFARRFGLIATNSLRQIFNRRVLQLHLTARDPLSIVFAIPDHPWVDSEQGAAVRISMTVGEAGENSGRLVHATGTPTETGDEVRVDVISRTGQIRADLTIGPDLSSAKSLLANERIANVGIALHARGLALDPEMAIELLSRARSASIADPEQYIRKTMNGRDVTQTPRGAYVIDLFGVDLAHLRTLGPIYQWVHDRVLPERKTNPRASYRENWWICGESRPDLRAALNRLAHYIVTPLTATHRFFIRLPSEILPDQALVVIASQDAGILSVLSSRIHIIWALSMGARLGVGNDPRYNKTRCFDTFPFPEYAKPHWTRMARLGESLDAHRKRQQMAYPVLTITGIYNVLEKLRSGEVLTAKEKIIHEQGLVSILKQIHDEFDAAVFDAYGWPHDLTDE